MGIWNLRAKVAILWLVLTLLVVGVVAWAISAEVVMGAMRDSARKNSDISTMRLHQFQSFDDNSDDFSINRINKNIGESSRKSGIRSSETALMREVVHKEKEINKMVNERQKPNEKQLSYEEKRSDFSDGDEGAEESLEAMEVIAEKTSTSSKKPYSLNLDLEKLRKSLTGADVAKVIDQLLSTQRKSKGNEPQIVVVAPGAQVANHKTKKTATNSKSNKSRVLKSSKETTTSTTTTTSKPFTTRTTLKPFDRSRIQSLSLKLSNTAVTTTKPKRTQLKVSTIKIRRTTTSTTPSTTTLKKTTTTSTTATTKPNSNKKKSKSRKTSSKSSKNLKSTITTTQTPTTKSMSSAQVEVLKSKIRQKELEILLSKVESLEKQQKHYIKQSNDEDLLAENSFRENVFKPNIEVIPFKQKHPEYNSGYSSRHTYDIQPKTHNTQQAVNWQPSPSLKASLLPPPPPPPPPPPMPNIPHPPQRPHQYPAPLSQHLHPSSSHAYAETHAIPISGKLIPEPNMMPMLSPGPQTGQLNGVFPIPNNRAISLGSVDPHMAQESNDMSYRIKQRGHTVHKSEKPGVQLSFGGGPMGGGGQLKTSPMGIFKTLLLPLLPKPRMNLNGKVVFGVVLENGVGFGKKPKIIAQHFSTGHI